VGASAAVTQRESNRRAILDAALELVASKGLGAFSSQELAEAAGVSRRTIFNHFPSVAAAIRAAFVDLVSSEVRASIGLLLGQVGEGASLGRVFDAMTKSLESFETPRVYIVLSRRIPGGLGNAEDYVFSAAVYDAAFRTLGTAIVERQPHLDPESVYVMVGCFLNAVNVAERFWGVRAGPKPTSADIEDLRAAAVRALTQIRSGFTT
jgi:AcrR family transcriptional regulator